MITAVIILLSYVPINILLGFIDSRIIYRKKGIKHWMNGLIYGALVGATYWWLYRDEALVAALFLERLLFFQISLSLFRSLRWDYMTPDPKSVTDKIQNKVFGGHGLVMYCIYALLLIVTLFIIFL